MTDIDPDLRPVTPEDAALVAELDLRRDPDSDSDPVRMRHWWAQSETFGPVRRTIGVRDGRALLFLATGHPHWKLGEPRFGWMRVAVDPSLSSESRYAGLVAEAEAWQREEGTAIAINRISSRFAGEIAYTEGLGYAEERRQRVSELDLGSRREEIFRSRDAGREQMAEGGITVHLLSDDRDADLFRNLYSMMIETEQDIPSTSPIPVLAYDEWLVHTFGDPGVHKDRFWIARDKAGIVGVSLLDFPTGRGVPFTSYTATARRARGLGIARALKYETMAQAIELGFTKVRTQNDGDNEPILHINKAMGYLPVYEIVELHRELG